MFTQYQRCACGAITLVDEQGDHYSVASNNRKRLLPGLDLRKIPRHPYMTSNCNHCVNHFGLDLCGCGSGELFGHCNNHLPECDLPMQSFGKYTSVVGGDFLAQKIQGGR